MSLADDLAVIPQIARGKVWCRICGRMQRVDGVACATRTGWPECCGQTMTIDSPEEQAALAGETPQGK